MLLFFVSEGLSTHGPGLHDRFYAREGAETTFQQVPRNANDLVMICS